MASSNSLNDLSKIALYVNAAKTPAERHRRKLYVHGMAYGMGSKTFAEMAQVHMPNGPSPLFELTKNSSTRQHKENPMATTSRPATNGKANAAKQEAARKLIADEAKQEVEKEPSILMQAHIAVNGARAENYGDQLTNFTNIADRMTLTLREKLIAPITPQEVALLMIDVKVARLVKTGGRHKDSIVDIAGYAECLDVVNRNSRNAESPMHVPV